MNIELEILRAISKETMDDVGRIRFILDEDWYSETEIKLRLQQVGIEDYDVQGIVIHLSDIGHTERRKMIGDPQLQSRVISNGIDFLNANTEKLSQKRKMRLFSGEI